MAVSLPSLFKGYNEPAPGPLRRGDYIVYHLNGDAWQAYRWPPDCQQAYLLCVWTPEMMSDCWRMEREEDPKTNVKKIAVPLGLEAVTQTPTRSNTLEWLLWS